MLPLQRYCLDCGTWPCTPGDSHAPPSLAGVRSVVGDTPLHLLTAGWKAEKAQQYLDAAAALLTAGGSATAPNMAGNTPLSLAQRHHIFQLERVFQEAAGAAEQPHEPQQRQGQEQAAGSSGHVPGSSQASAGDSPAGCRVLQPQATAGRPTPYPATPPSGEDPTSAANPTPTAPPLDSMPGVHCMQMRQVGLPGWRRQQHAYKAHPCWAVLLSVQRQLPQVQLRTQHIRWLPLQLLQRWLAQVRQVRLQGAVCRLYMCPHFTTSHTAQSRLHACIPRLTLFVFKDDTRSKIKLGPCRPGEGPAQCCLLRRRGNRAAAAAGEL